MNDYETKIGRRWRGYYITAYGLAVKHGFTGTEEEWLETLKGVSVELRYDVEAQALQWKHEGAPDVEWTDIVALDELRGPIVEQTLSEAKASRDAAALSEENAAASTAAAAESETRSQAQAEASAGSAAAAGAQAETARAGAAEALAHSRAAAESAAESRASALDAASGAAAAAEHADASALHANAAAEGEAASALNVELSRSWAMGGTGSRAGEDEDNAMYWASRAAAEAERAATPAQGVYNFVLQDRATAERYALMIENGALKLLGVTAELDAAEPVLIDSATGLSYTLVVESGVLAMEEV